MGNKYNIPDQIDDFIDETEFDVENVEMDSEETSEDTAVNEIPAGISATGSALTRYITTIRKFPILSAEEQAALWAEGTPEAKEKIINSHLPLVINIVNKIVGFAGHNENDLLDLISSGNAGLVIAANKFNPDKGTKFITYATYWVQVEVNNARAELMNGGIKKTAYVTAGIGLINQTEELLGAILERPVDKEDVKMALVNVMSSKRIDTLYEIRNIGAMRSLDMVYNEGDDDACTLGDCVSDPNEVDVGTKIDQEQTHNILTDAIMRLLDAKEQIVVNAFYGLGEFADAPMSGNQIAKLLKEKKYYDRVVSKQMVDRIKSKALEKLREDPAIAGLM